MSTDILCSFPFIFCYVGVSFLPEHVRSVFVSQGVMMTIFDTLIDSRQYAKVTMYESTRVVLGNRNLLINRVWFDRNIPPATFRCEAAARNPYFVTRNRGRERAILIVPPHGPMIVSFDMQQAIIAELKQRRYRHFIDDSDWA